MKKLLIFLFVFTFSISNACSCIYSEFNKKDYEAAALIVKGIVVDVKLDKANHEKIITFKVYKTYNGKQYKNTKIKNCT